MILIKDKYQIIEFFEEQKMMRFEVYKKTEDLSEQEYVELVFEPGINLLKEKKPKKLLLNTQKFKYLLSPETEKNLQKIVLETYEYAGVEKLAIIIPTDIFAQISIAELTDIETPFDIKYFVREKKALKWLDE